MAPGRPDETRILLAASHLIDSKASRNAALAFILADRSLIYVRKLLGPVLLDKSLKTSASEPNSLFPHALAFARETLEAEIARALEPYPDWSRPFPDSRDAGAPLIRELAAFVADPDAETHSFKCSEGYRSQIEAFIRQHQLDLDCTTVKSSRPYSLVCTKNDKSYHHNLASRAAEIELTRKLAGLSSPP
jgi:hypothetical protein